MLRQERKKMSVSQRMAELRTKGKADARQAERLSAVAAENDGNVMLAGECVPELTLDAVVSVIEELVQLAGQLIRIISWFFNVLFVLLAVVEVVSIRLGDFCPPIDPILEDVGVGYASASCSALRQHHDALLYTFLIVALVGLATSMILGRIARRGLALWWERLSR